MASSIQRLSHLSSSLHDDTMKRSYQQSQGPTDIMAHPQAHTQSFMNSQQHQQQQPSWNSISPMLMSRSSSPAYNQRAGAYQTHMNRKKDQPTKRSVYWEQPNPYTFNGQEAWGAVSTSSGVTLDSNPMFAKREFAFNQIVKKPAVHYNPIKQHQQHHAKPLNRSNSDERAVKMFKDNDYTNNYIHSDSKDLPVKYVRNVKNSVEGYPKLQRLFQLKENQTEKYACTPFGARVDVDNMVSTLNKWIYKDNLVFDVIMIGALTENQFIYPLLSQLPLEKLCSKPGFLFIWASAKKINELTGLLKSDGWSKKFRRSEELVFVPVTKDSPYYPKDENSCDEDSLFEKMQWHCWMCITGTVRRSTDGHLIHCNVDTDLKIENEAEPIKNFVVPNHIYKVTENFSSATRRLHIIPSRTGFNNPVKPRKGWVVMSPDVVVDNFDANRYKAEISRIGNNVPQTQEIESVRPRSPVPRSAQLNTKNSR
ncbi:hypothetical protein WICPIJ_004299 [Wickerhamomyces pijperi]|uniref:Karyogamy protein KAR4 n=1 Tax=Wickerhamomyces pijperi TaxID=599730 RepID=A0A9P8Q5V7_WICPI|nr:hypothetical protein WICPIJ_004299 [Wickerhamomyces pijperi]